MGHSMMLMKLDLDKVNRNATFPWAYKRRIVSILKGVSQ